MAVIAVDTGDVRAARLGRRRRAAGARARRCSRSPTPAGAACARRSASCPRPAAASAARAGAASPARSSTPRRSRAAPPAGRWSTPPGDLLGLNAVRRDGGFILALPADAALRRRAGELARGEAAERPRLGVALAPPRVARKHARRGRAPRSRRPARARRGRRQPGRDGRSRARRPAGPRGRSRARGHGRPVRRARRAPATRSRVAVVRGTEERELEIVLRSRVKQLQFVKSCDILRFRAELRLSRLPYRRHRLREVDAARDPRSRRRPRRASASSSARSRASRRAPSRCACGRSRRRASSRARRSPRSRRASSTR